MNKPSVRLMAITPLSLHSWNVSRDNDVYDESLKSLNCTNCAALFKDAGSIAETVKIILSNEIGYIQVPVPPTP